MEALRPNQQRAQHAILVFWILAGVLFLMLIIDFNALRMLNNSAPETPEPQQISALQSILSLVLLLVQVAGAVFFILWFRRAYANLHRLDTVEVNHADSWAVWSWFIPILNFFRPYNIMKEIWIKTQEAYKGAGKDDSRWLVDLWWLFFLLQFWMMLRLLSVNTDIESIISVRLFADVVMLIGTLLAIEMLYRTKQYEAAFYRHTQDDPMQHLVETSAH